jgi:5-methylcytosine-specific restriction endonuclease McrA
MEIKCARVAQQQAEAEAKRAARAIENSPERKPWLAITGGAERFRWRYQNDPEFAQRERERTIVFRCTHPDLAVKSDRGNHWLLAASRSDGSVTEDVVRALLRAAYCYLCGIDLTPANRSIDHRIALTLGGNHTASNLAPCCLPCNREKAKYERRQARAQHECESNNRN